MKRVFFLVVSLLLTLILTVSAFGWFAAEKKKVNSEGFEIDNPPIIFINDYRGIDDVNVLDMNDMNIGETYYIIFSVMPKLGVNILEYDLIINYSRFTNSTMSLYRVSNVTAEQPASGAYESKRINGKTYYYLYDKAAKLQFEDSTCIIPDYETDTLHTTASNEENDLNITYKEYKDQKFDDMTYHQLPWNNTEETEGDTRGTAFYILEISWESLPDNADPKDVDMMYVIATNAVIGASTTP